MIRVNRSNEFKCSVVRVFHSNVFEIREDQRALQSWRSLSERVLRCSSDWKKIQLWSGHGGVLPSALAKCQSDFTEAQIHQPPPPPRSPSLSILLSLPGSLCVSLSLFPSLPQVRGTNIPIAQTTNTCVALFLLASWWCFPFPAKTAHVSSSQK